jgi:hypothetical protein
MDEARAGALLQEIGSTADLSKLVDNNLYQPDDWKARLNGLARRGGWAKGLQENLVLDKFREQLCRIVISHLG